MNKTYTPAFKARLVQELLKETKTISQLAAEYGIHPNLLGTWKATALQGLPSLFERRDSLAAVQAAHEQQVQELYAQIGRLMTQVAWLRKKSGLDPDQKGAPRPGRPR
jgi:transposase